MLNVFYCTPQDTLTCNDQSILQWPTKFCFDWPLWPSNIFWLNCVLPAIEYKDDNAFIVYFIVGAADSEH